MGADCVLGRGVAARLGTMGHEVVGFAYRRPVSWPGSVAFVEADLDDTSAVRRAVAGADVVAHCGWSTGADTRSRDGVDVNTAANLLDAIAAAGVRRVVFESSISANGLPTDTLLRDSGMDWVTIRCGVLLGRDADDSVLRRFARPLVLDIGGSGTRPMQVVHPHDAQRLFVIAVLDSAGRTGAVNLAAAGWTTSRRVAAALGRPMLRIPWRSEALAAAPLPDTSQLRDEWGYTPVWTADECVHDFALAARGRVTVGSRLIGLPWRVARVREVPAADAAAPDGVAPVFAGIPGANGEFDTPIDPRFPAFVATNLSEALPGPFTPASASVGLRGTRAAGTMIAARLYPAGLVAREMSVRTTAVFAHRLYAGVTSSYYIARTVPLVDPDTLVAGFFGRTADGVPIFADERPPGRGGVATQLRNMATFATNLVGFSLSARCDTGEFIAEVDRLERLAADRGALDDRRLRELIVLARDHAVHGWVLASASILVCTAYHLIMRILSGRDITALAGPEVASAQCLAAVHRLAADARRSPTVAALLQTPGPHLDTLARHIPHFHAAFEAELALIGHRGPAEVEVASNTYADDPELLLRMVAKATVAATLRAPQPPDVPVWARPFAAEAAVQLRDREVRRDKMVRAIWVLRNLLREFGQRLVRDGALADPDDVFYLLVDELDALPADLRGLVATRRREWQRLAALVPPEAFSGQWRPVSEAATVLRPGDSLHGLGVSGGRARGRARVVEPHNLAELRPGEVLVAKVTDVGYTPAYAFAAAVVTELGGPISHAAIVAREYGLPCVVNARAATGRLPTGSLIEVDGGTGHITMLS
jgi:nucleoside-diphosphate-sugar epimerase/phosphohistidine swiveling domain-containing protein